MVWFNINVLVDDIIKKDGSVEVRFIDGRVVRGSYKDDDEEAIVFNGDDGREYKLNLEDWCLFLEVNNVFDVLQLFGEVKVEKEVIKKDEVRKGTFKVSDLVSNDWTIIDKEKSMSLILENKAGKFMFGGDIEKYIRDDFANDYYKDRFKVSLVAIKSEYISDDIKEFKKKVIKRKGNIVLVKNKMYDYEDSFYYHSSKRKELVWVDEKYGVEFIGFVPVLVRVFQSSDKHSSISAKELEVIGVYRIVNEKDFGILVRKYWMDDDWEEVECVEVIGKFEKICQ